MRFWSLSCEPCHVWLHALAGPLQDSVAIAEPTPKASGIGPMSASAAIAPGPSQDALAFPPHPPPSLPDTLPFFVDLEESGHDLRSHISLAPVPPHPDTVTPPLSPQTHLVRPASFSASPVPASALIRSPTVSPGASSASWSFVPPVAPPPSMLPSASFGPCSRWCRGSLSLSYRSPWPPRASLRLSSCRLSARHLGWIPRFRPHHLPSGFGP